MQSLVLDVAFSPSVGRSSFHLQIVPRHQLIDLCRMYWNEQHARKPTTGAPASEDAKPSQTNLVAHGKQCQMRSMPMRSALLIALNRTCIRVCDQVQPLASFRKCLTVCSGLRLMGLEAKGESIARCGAGAMRLCRKRHAINEVCRLSPSCLNLVDI